MASADAVEASIYHCFKANCSLLGKKCTREFYTAIPMSRSNF